MKKLQRQNEPDPGVVHRFIVQVDGVSIAHFHEVSGLTWETEVVEHKEGGLNDRVHMLLGQTKVSRLVLKNGITSSQDLWKWRQDVINNRPGLRRDGSIIMLDIKGTPVTQWNFHRAWPSKWEGPTFSTGQSSTAVETVELAYETLERKKGG